MNLWKKITGLKIVQSEDYFSLQNQIKCLNSEKTTLEASNSDLSKKLIEAEEQLSKEERAKKLAVSDMQEAMNLAESYLADQKDAEARYTEISRILSQEIKNGNHLSRSEKIVFEEFILPKICDTPLLEKINLGSQHNYPKGSDKFVERIAAIPYISKVRRGITHTGTLKTTKLKKLEDVSNGYCLRAFYVNGSRGVDGVEIDINTTAKNNIQYEFIYRVLSKELGIE